MTRHSDEIGAVRIEATGVRALLGGERARARDGLARSSAACGNTRRARGSLLRHSPHEQSLRVAKRLGDDAERLAELRAAPSPEPRPASGVVSTAKPTRGAAPERRRRPPAAVTVGAVAGAAIYAARHHGQSLAPPCPQPPGPLRRAKSARERAIRGMQQKIVRQRIRALAPPTYDFSSPDGEWGIEPGLSLWREVRHPRCEGPAPRALRRGSPWWRRAPSRKENSHMSMTTSIP